MFNGANDACLHLVSEGYDDYTTARRRRHSELAA